MLSWSHHAVHYTSMCPLFKDLCTLTSLKVPAFFPLFYHLQFYYSYEWKIKVEEIQKRTIKIQMEKKDQIHTTNKTFYHVQSNTEENLRA